MRVQFKRIIFGFMVLTALQANSKTSTYICPVIKKMNFSLLFWSVAFALIFLLLLKIGYILRINIRLLDSSLMNLDN